MTPRRNLRLYVVRHGRTALNAAGRLRGRNDVGLDPVGRCEADRLAVALAGAELARVVSSPLRRAVETATPIARVHGLAVELDDDLLDRDYGEWEGHPAAEVRARYGSVEAAPGVEPAASFEGRVRRALRRWTFGAPGTSLLVAHDAVNACLLRLMIPALAGRTIVQHTGCWNELVHDGVRWRAVVIDRVPHGG